MTRATATSPLAPRAEAAAPADPLRAAEVSLRRSLDWRSRVLLEGASRDALVSDGPVLVELLRSANESIIRQPPAAAFQALALARNADTPIDQLAELFEHDPMLAQGLLRQANSAFYRRDDVPCTSIHAGVQRIGLAGVQSVLTASMIQQTLCRPGGEFDAYVQKVWSHMQRTAPLARALAPAFGVDPESAFSFALLHDVGKLVVFDHVSRMRHEQRREMKMPGLFFRQLLWHLHEPLGGLAVLRWELGLAAAHAIGEHHRRPVPETPDPVTECLFVSEAVELAQTNYARLDWEKIWQDGGITTDAGAVQERMEKPEA